MYGARFSVRHFDELDSTNRYLIDEAGADAAEGLVVRADHQSAGRGRLGRRWEAPAGANLLVSVLLRPDLAVGELHLCTVAMALAARAACLTAAGVEASVKWPNDLLVGESKLAGILAESVPDQTGGRRAVVVGLGLNVGWPAPDGPTGTVAAPDDLAGTATSLWRESGLELAPADLLVVLLAELGPRLDDLAGAGGRDRLVSAYRSVCGTLGRPVEVTLADGTFTGTASDITAGGRLVVDVAGSARTVTAGDVVHLRPAP